MVIFHRPHQDRGSLLSPQSKRTHPCLFCSYASRKNPGFIFIFICSLTLPVLCSRTVLSTRVFTTVTEHWIISSRPARTGPALITCSITSSSFIPPKSPCSAPGKCLLQSLCIWSLSLGTISHHILCCKYMCVLKA